MISCHRQVIIEEMPFSVQQAIEQAGDNRPELEKAVAYFQAQDDSLKLQALYFLLENMENHYSADYYWKDRNGTRVDFDEFTYPDFPSAVAGMDKLREKKGTLLKQDRSEEHTSELQSRENLVCRLLLEKKKKIK